MYMFSHDVYENIRTRVIVMHAGNILLLEPEAAGDGWRLPGGGMERDESLTECAAREVMEETGIVITVTNVAFLREFVIPKYCTIPEGKGTAYSIEVYLYATPTTANIEPRRENAERPLPHWIAYAEVAALPVWPKELKTLALWLAAGNVPFGAPSFVSKLESPDTPAPDVRFA